MRDEKITENTSIRKLTSVRMTRSEWMELGFAALVASSSLFLFLRARQYIDRVLLEPEEIPPIFFPRLVLFVIFSLSVLVMVRTVLGKSKDEVELAWPGVRRMLVVLAVLFVYVLIFKVLGFIITTVLVMLFLSWYYGNKNLLKLLALAIVFPPLVYYLFTRVFHILLPRGIL
jgi:putative tricarboxylic transport membrane protein